MAEAVRTYPLEKRHFAANGVSLVPVEAKARVSLRAAPDAFPSIESAIGFELPKKPGQSIDANGIQALWIGPDEWLLIASLESSLVTDLKAAENAATFSSVDVSHRNTAISVSGENAAAALNSGCPRDLSIEGFPVGKCSRTMLAKAEIVIWRNHDNDFHVECWRSFSDYVWKFLVDAAKSA